MFTFNSFVAALFVLLPLSTNTTTAPADVGAAESDLAALWSRDNRRALERMLAQRDRHGLDKLAFPDLDGSADGYNRAALRYASALSSGIVDPASLHSVYTVQRPVQAMAGDLRAALREHQLARWLDSLAPQDDSYRTLSEAYIAAKQDQNGVTQPRLHAEHWLRPGDVRPGVAMVAAQLQSDGYLASSFTDSRFTRQMANAVEALQRDYGIAVDGIVGPDTLAVLNLRPGDRARALAVALERRRWLPREAPPTRIDVNTAAATLRYYRDGALIDERRVIAGAPATETPPLQSPIYRLVANPTWTVPKSIQRGELAGVGHDYLRAHNMVLRNGWIVQVSGPKNALGLVKFDMKNEQAIYLHDTSAKELFGRTQRHLSHGCIRIQDALGFAEILAEHGDVAEQWQRARTSREETSVALNREIPVRLLYHNVFIASDGTVTFRTDPYGWNAPIAEALGFRREPVAKAQPAVSDISP